MEKIVKDSGSNQITPIQSLVVYNASSKPHAMFKIDMITQQALITLSLVIIQ
jgi:hypothetical protein